MSSTTKDELSDKILLLVNSAKESVYNFVGDENINFINKHRVTLLIAMIIVIIFIFVATIGYDNYVKPILDKTYIPNKEFIPDNENNNITIYFFYTTWCPYCKKARIEWNKFKKEIEDNSLLQQTFNITFKEIDCDKNADLAKKFNVEGYPTIKLEKNNKIFNYDAKPNAHHLMEFFNGSL